MTVQDKSGTEWYEKYRKETEKRHEEVRNRIKEVVPKFRLELLAMGAEKIEARYDGSGDSGSLSEISLLTANGTVFEIEDGNIPEPEIFKDNILNIFYDVLEVRYAGWENNEGAFGHFEWDLVEDKVNHVHKIRIMTEETTEHEGW